MERISCPFCNKNAIFVGIHDDEGNYHGEVGCSYEAKPYSGLFYALHHEGWGDCVLCTSAEDTTMGGMLFLSAEAAIATLNKYRKTAIQPVTEHCKNTLNQLSRSHHDLNNVRELGELNGKIAAYQDVLQLC